MAVFSIFTVYSVPSFATNVDSGEDATCDEDTLESPTGPVRLRAEFTPEIINLKWYDEDGNRVTVPTASNSCTYDTSISLPPNPIKTGYKFKGWKVVPYNSIEYLESTGTQWIDTGFKFTGNVVKYDLVYVIPAALQDKTLFGASDNNVNWSGLQYYYGNDGINNQLRNGLYVGGLSWSATSQDTIGTTYVYSLTVDRNNLTWNRSKNGSTNSGTFTGTVTSNVNVTLFAHNMGNSVVQRAAYRVYSFKITQDGVVVRDFVPAKDASGVACMYDKVSGTFFYNAGSGNFTAGPDV